VEVNADSISPQPLAISLLRLQLCGKKSEKLPLDSGFKPLPLFSFDYLCDVPNRFWRLIDNDASH